MVVVVVVEVELEVDTNRFKKEERRFLKKINLSIERVTKRV